MNVTSNRLLLGFNKALQFGGNQISVKWFYQTYDDVYDEALQLNTSGTLWTSGVMFPVGRGTEDAMLLEQGKLLLGDSKIFIAGSLALSSVTGSPLQVKIGIGSPGNSFYSVILPGTVGFDNEDNHIYKIAYIRRLTTGSLIGE